MRAIAGLSEFLELRGLNILILFESSNRVEVGTALVTHIVYTLYYRKNKSGHSTHARNTRDSLVNLLFAFLLADIMQ